MKHLWTKWKQLAEKAGNTQANFIFAILFYLVIVPVGVVMGLFKDFLYERSKPVWHAIDAKVNSLEEMKEQ